MIPEKIDDPRSLYIFTVDRRVIHTVGPKYAVKYHTAAENALSHCYRSCLELLIENGLQRSFEQMMILFMSCFASFAYC